MKKSKVMIPVMTLGLAVGLAFANTANQSNGWIDLNGTPTQLSSDPCTGTGNDCKVRFEEDPNQQVFEVYTDITISDVKQSVSSETYILPGTPPSN
ncbi:DUF6520 family protein [Leeuwenhoekiella marinoflava]|nr:DUF6520 family protein [Leeuwenhoekiella marinoflava]